MKAPDRLLRKWPLLNAASQELHQVKLPLPAWAGGLVPAMLGQLKAARLRQPLDKENLPAAPAAAARDRSVR